MTTKVKYRQRTLSHTLTIYTVARDSYGKETLTETTVSGYIELDRIASSGAGTSGAQHMSGVAVVPGSTTVSIGDYIEYSGLKRKIADINEVRGFRDEIWRKELIF